MEKIKVNPNILTISMSQNIDEEDKEEMLRTSSYNARSLGNKMIIGNVAYQYKRLQDYKAE